MVYGFSFLINGPLTDRLGGRFAILLGGFGACIANALMGLCAYSLLNQGQWLNKSVTLCLSFPFFMA